MKIYTKKGDKGITGLYGGSRVLKSDLRVHAYGTVDELNSFLGSLIESVKEKVDINLLLKLQHELFELGAALASDKDRQKKAYAIVKELESKMDEMSAALPPLKYFVLPGGSEANSKAHICRAVCRRAERFVVELNNELGDEYGEELVFLNRLSDYFFMLARYVVNIEKLEEHKWLPHE